jgi:FkbM family methyltransferase
VTRPGAGVGDANGRARARRRRLPVSDGVGLAYRRRVLDITRAYNLTFLFPEGDTAVGESLRTYGEFARPEVEFVVDHLRGAAAPGAYVDVGANIGAIALPVAAAGRRTKVIAIEAHRGLAGVLAANALNNQLYNVEVLHAAAGAERGLAEFPSSSLATTTNFGTLGMHLNADLPTEAVRMCTLDEVAPDDTLFVKLDVEGFESEVLKGASRLIETVRPVWLIEAGDENARGRVRRDEDHGRRRLHAALVLDAVRQRGSPQTCGLAPEEDQGRRQLRRPPCGAENRWSLSQVSSPPPQPPWEFPLSHYGYLKRFGY